MRVILVMFKDSERRDFPLEKEQIILGRRQDCDLRVPTKDVSRQHCAITLQKGRVTVKDLGSSNGTFVNETRVAETRLKAGDRLRVGPVTFLVQIDGQPANLKPEDAQAPTGTATPTLAKEEDTETFELSEDDFDLDDALEALDKFDDDEKDMP